jgi:hypothetical protein
MRPTIKSNALEEDKEMVVQSRKNFQQQISSKKMLSSFMLSRMFGPSPVLGVHGSVYEKFLITTFYFISIKTLSQLYIISQYYTEHHLSSSLIKQFCAFASSLVDLHLFAQQTLM